MKILWLSHFVPYPPKAGMLIRSYNLLKQLCLGNDVDLVALARADTLRTMYPSVEAGLSDARRALGSLCRRIDLVPTPIGSTAGASKAVALKSLLPGPPYTVRWFASEAMGRAVAAALAENEYDVIHCDTIGLAPYVPATSSATVLDHHNIESDMLFRRARQARHPAKQLYFWQEAARLQRYEQRVCPRFDLHITCSDVDSQRLGRIVPSLNIETVPNGVDVEYFAPTAAAPSGDRLVFAGGLNWYPNRDAMEYFAAEIWPLLCRRYKDIEFDLIGKSPSEPLRALARRDLRFKVHGFVDDIRKYVHAASVYVCPIRDGGGTKLKILDALALGKAVVAHPVAVEGIDVTPEQDILLATEPAEFATQIGRVLDDDAFRARLERSARDLAVRRYSFDGIGTSLRRLYAETVRAKREQRG